MNDPDGIKDGEEFELNGVRMVRRNVYVGRRPCKMCQHIRRLVFAAVPAFLIYWMLSSLQ